MARTYRLRHLPRFGGRKFIDAQSAKRWWLYREAHEARLLAEGLTELQVWQAVRCDLWSLPAPPCGAWCHPWCQQGRRGSFFTDFKRLGNRWARRKTRTAVRLGMDPDQPAGHEPREFWQPRDYR